MAVFPRENKAANSPARHQVCNRVFRNNVATARREIPHEIEIL